MKGNRRGDWKKSFKSMWKSTKKWKKMCEKGRRAKRKQALKDGEEIDGCKLEQGERLDIK